MAAVRPPISVLCRVLAHFLEKSVMVNDQVQQSLAVSPTRFHSSEKPTVPLAEFLARFELYGRPQVPTIVVAIVLLDRAQQTNLRLLATSFTIHRLLMTSMLLAFKFVEDFFPTNELWAKIGGVSLQEMNIMERELFLILQGNLNFDAHCYNQYANWINIRIDEVTVPRPEVSQQPEKRVRVETIT